jgi:ADP-heptose:LPS heptosyltransferase
LTQKERIGKSLVLTHPARLGDSVLSLPLHRAIAMGGELESNVGLAYRFLFDLTSIKAGYPGPLYPKGASALFREARTLRGRRIQTVFLVRPNLRSAFLARFAGIPVRVGDATEGRGSLLTHRVKAPRSNQIDRLRAFGEAVGLEVPTEFGLPRPERVETDLIGIVPGTSYSDKLIPPPALRGVCEKLIDAGYRLALLGGPGEERWSESLAGLPAENWIGRYSLPDLIEPLSSLRTVIAADGGLYHLSVACGVPSVGVYGPTTKRLWWHDWGCHVPVLAPGDVMANVTSDHLWAAVDKALSTSGCGERRPAQSWRPEPALKVVG